MRRVVYKFDGVKYNGNHYTYTTKSLADARQIQILTGIDYIIEYVNDNSEKL